MMRPLRSFTGKVSVVLTDIDDTLTDQGQLGKEAYSALWDLNDAGIHVIPVTGRPAGWCELIARQWPVRAVIGENGALYFTHEHGQMKRFYDPQAKLFSEKKVEFQQILAAVKKAYPTVAEASDQFCRLFDLAIDFCEDVPKHSLDQARNIQKIFENFGATAKVSSIHVNGWFGSFNKLSMTNTLLKDLFGYTSSTDYGKVAFIGDSLNDEPMWSAFENSFAVANVLQFQNQLKFPPQYVSPSPGGKGFREFANHLLGVTSY